MKPLKLTNEQKENLLEMIKKLFPEYDWYAGFSTFYEQLGDSPYEEVDLGYLHLLGFHDKKGNFPDMYIHWFEFCVIWIPEKLVYHPKFKNEFIIGMPQYLDQSEVVCFVKESLASLLPEVNPIDYLYEEFKKLQK